MCWRLFHHPRPQAETHVVVIPKDHVASLLSAMMRAVQESARRLGLDRRSFRLMANAAASGVTPHMH